MFTDTSQKTAEEVIAATQIWLERAVIGLNLCPFAKQVHVKNQFAGTEPDDIGNYTNRSPYPTLHLLREASIERAVAVFPDAAQIFKKNIETLRRLGHDGWRRLGIPTS